MYWSTKSAMSRTTRQTCSMNLTSAVSAVQTGSFSSVNQLGFCSSDDLTSEPRHLDLGVNLRDEDARLPGRFARVVADVVVEVGARSPVGLRGPGGRSSTRRRRSWVCWMIFESVSFEMMVSGSAIIPGIEGGIPGCWDSCLSAIQPGTRLDVGEECRESRDEGSARTPRIGWYRTSRGIEPGEYLDLAGRFSAIDPASLGRAPSALAPCSAPSRRRPRRYRR